MKTYGRERNFKSELTKEDKNTLKRIIKLLSPLERLEKIGRYSQMTSEEIWEALVVQVCVMRSAQFMERLRDNKVKYKEFKSAISLKLIKQEQNPIEHLSKIFKSFSATFNYNKNAGYLAEILDSPDVFKKGKSEEIILLQGLSHEDDPIQVRDKLIERCPHFGLKSASDFMIVVGLSHDVIAFDTRIIGTFHKYFGYNYIPEKFRGNKKRYLSLENTLRSFCKKQQISLALLDRILFRFSNMSVIDFIVKYPEVIN